MLAFLSLPIALVVLAAIAAVLVVFLLVRRSDQEADDILNAQKARTGLDVAVAYPLHYDALGQPATSRRVSQTL